MEIIEKFKKHLLEQKKKPTLVTVKNYFADIRHFIQWYEISYQKEFTPVALTHECIERFKKEKSQTYSFASLQRHISSLRKFSTFLYSEGFVVASPLKETLFTQELADPFHINEFRTSLVSHKTAVATVKNYILDITHFVRWCEATDNTLLKTDFSSLSIEIFEKYQSYLQQQVFSISSINRKLSSLRKYFKWLLEKKYLSPLAFPYMVSNVVAATNTVALASPSPVPHGTLSVPTLTDSPELLQEPPLELFSTTTPSMHQTISPPAIVSTSSNEPDASSFIEHFSKSVPSFYTSHASNHIFTRGKTVSKSGTIGQESFLMRLRRKIALPFMKGMLNQRVTTLPYSHMPMSRKAKNSENGPFSRISLEDLYLEQHQ